jgi:hypothetical protein
VALRCRRTLYFAARATNASEAWARQSTNQQPNAAKPRRGRDTPRNGIGGTREKQMTKERLPAQVSKKRTLNTYNELLFGSEILFNRAKADKQGSYWVMMASAVLTAFAMEAYLNHIGPKIFTMWDVLETLSPSGKIDVVCEKLGLSFPRGRRPRQSVEDLFRFRNQLAHAKSVKLEMKDVTDDVESFMDPVKNRRPLADWEKFCFDIENIERVREDVVAIIRKVHETAKPSDDPVFDSGFTTVRATLAK